MTEGAREEVGSNGDATKRESGCPVRSSGSREDPTGSGGASSSGRAGGVWSSIAAWVPFLGGRGDTTSDSTSSSNDNGVIDANSGSAVSSSSSSSSNTIEHGGGCPVKDLDDGGGGGASSSGCPVQHDSSSSAAAVAPSSGNGLAGLSGAGLAGGGLAEAGAEEGYNALTNEYVYGQEVVPGQEMPLSTSRQRSSIPKAEFNPSHQPQAATTWVYPSEQQYYNAIKRKGYKASATDMPSTLAIHNAVNEKGWEMIKDWEKARALAAAGGGGGGGGGDGGGGGGEVDIPPPKLLRFTGRPQDTSPKAWVKSNLLGYRPPFDRHDWVVKREDGTEARYVIDFYAGKAPPGSNVPVAMHLDVRPALDSFDAAIDRTRMFYTRGVRPYMTGVLDAFKNDPGASDKSGEDAPPPPSAGR